MVTRAERTATDPDPGVPPGRLLFAVRREFCLTRATRGERNCRQSRRMFTAITEQQRAYLGADGEV